MGAEEECGRVVGGGGGGGGAGGCEEAQGKRGVCGRVSFYLVVNEKEEESPSESEDASDPSE